MANFEDLIIRDITANRPAAGIPGRLFYDTTLEKMQRDNGSTWDDCEPTIPGAYTDEMAQDAVGGMAAGSLVYDDGTPSLQLDGDNAAPGADMVYGTNGSGVKGWKADPAGGPGGSSFTNSSISPTTANVTAAVAYRYFADISGLTADRNFVLPTCVAGDEIELKITTGDDTYELIVIGDTGVTIEGGSAATEWSRLFISGECVHFVASGTDAWRVTYDGRIPCQGKMTLTAADTTNSAATPTLPTWDSADVNVGEICDLTNYRFNIRRAGLYIVSGSYRPNSAPTDQNYIAFNATQNATAIIQTLIRQSGTNSISCPLSPSPISCAAGDAIYFYYETQASNRGILNSAQTYCCIREA